MGKKIFIAGGGTGGHIYPGLAIARGILALDPKVEIHFVGTANGLETKIIPKENLQLHCIQGGKINFVGNLPQKIMTLLKVPVGILQSAFLIFKYRPDFVLGVGGYASFPFVFAASLLGRKTAVWDGDAHPGVANQMLARFVDLCFIVFDDAKKYLNKGTSADKCLNFGMPVRAEVEKAATAGMPKSTPDGFFHLFSFGGSQGSRAISKALSDLLLKRPQWTEKTKVVHQIGSVDWQMMQQKYRGQEDFVTPKEFIYNMPETYAWADLVVCRGGASTIAELAAFGVPAIIVPLPAANDHQQRNAESLVKADAAKMILQKDLSPESLDKEIQALMQDEARRKNLSKNIQQFFRPQAAARIAQKILEVCA